MFQLTPVERYAVQFMETQVAPLATEELQKAEVRSLRPDTMDRGRETSITQSFSFTCTRSKQRALLRAFWHHQPITSRFACCSARIIQTSSCSENFLGKIFVFSVLTSGCDGKPLGSQIELVKTITPR